MFLLNRQLYSLCQLFPESASSSLKFVLRDAMHEMEGMVETRGRAAFPGLDVVSRGQLDGQGASHAGSPVLGSQHRRADE